MEKLSVSKERVIEAANKCSTAKNILMVLFPEVFEVPKPKYEIGKWYKYDVSYFFRVLGVDGNFFLSDNSNYNTYSTDLTFGNRSVIANNSVPATKEEVEKHLISLYDKKGFKLGVRINRRSNLIRKHCKAIYETHGSTKVYEYAKKIRLNLSICSACEVETPTIKDGKINECAICGQAK